MTIITGIVLMIAMMIVLVAYRLGLSDGQKLVRGETVKVEPVRAVLNTLKKTVQTSEEAERIRELAAMSEGLSNIIAYAGEKQE